MMLLMNIVVRDLGSFLRLKPINLFDILHPQPVFLVIPVKVDVASKWLFVFGRGGRIC